MKRFILILMLVLLAYVQSAQAAEKVMFIRINSSINPGTSDFIHRAIEQARTANAQCLVIELDTPGGLLDSTRDIVKDFLNADIPIVVYVAPRGGRAGSAGVFITMAAHVAAMAPGTNIGAAHPVSALGKDPESEGGKHMAQKIENDTSAFIETIANQRKRNVEWGRKAVLESVSVTEEKAKELTVIDFIASDRADLMRQLDGRVVTLPLRKVTLSTKDAAIENIEMSWKQSFVDLFSNPNIIYFLIVIAMLGIYLELSHPGAILPGVAAGLSIILILISSQSLPFNVGGILLLVLGAIFFVLEVYVTSFGMLALGGIVCFILGSLLLFDAAAGFGAFHVSRLLILGTTVGLTAIIATTLYFIAKSQKVRVSTGREGLVGEEGVVVEALQPEGQVVVHGEYWKAAAPHHVDVGVKVRVVSVDGLKINVSVSEQKEKI